MNYFFQRKEKYLRIFTIRLDKIDELSKTIDYDDFKFFISNSDTETDFSELKDPVAFLDNIRKHEISTEEVRHK